MVHARLVCSDHGCEAVYELYGPLEEVDALACDCGCALQALAWPHPVEERGRAPAGMTLVALDC